MRSIRLPVVLAAGLCLSAISATVRAQEAGNFGPVSVTLGDPCAVYSVSTTDGTATYTKIVYGEPVNFNISGTVVAVLDTTSATANLKFMISAHGDGVGQTTGGKYVFNGKLQAKANTTGNVLDPDFRFNGSFKLSARVIGQGNAGSTATTVAQGAQDNAVFDFYVRVNYANGQASGIFDNTTTNFTLTCQASPWSNQMTALQAGTKNPVGRGFGDVWNKYAWAMQDFNGGLLVGTKNAWYDIARLASYSDTSDTSPAAQCTQNPANLTPAIYKPLACAELYEAPAETGSPAANTRFAEIWRLDYAKKTWSRVRDDAASQGFRIMALHGAKLYVGSDLGSFISGVDLINPGASFGTWNFPGSRLLVSSDGLSFSEVACGPTVNGPCNSATSAALTPVPPNVNISFRALASFGGKLYVGTFNNLGGELWSYAAGQASPWTLVKKFAPTHPAVTELAVFNNKLYIGLGGPGADYLYVHTGSGTPGVVPGLPALPATAIGVLKLFASSKGQLYVGSVDLVQGFSLLSMSTAGAFTTVTNTGFANSSNGYPWSMAELNGRVFLGSFNTGFLNNLPRGSAELWYSDDGTSWQQMALPLDFGYLNYGIRTMSVANKQLYLGTASVIVAPDLVTQPVPLSPGTEVWSIRGNTATR